MYTNLGVGSYRFRVIASNSDGLWNSAEAVIPFVLEPAFWQAWWFRWMCVFSIAFIVFALYRLRLHQLTRQLNVRFEERLAERMRIAHELHDTLLQGFLGASVQLDFALDQTPEEAPTRPLLKRALELMRRVNEEGRNALRGLRSSGWEFHDLEQAFLRVPQELEIREGIDFRVTVQEQPRMLHPFIRDEAYRIGREALVNAFRHAQARNIEVELEYAPNFLRILVRDDGCGIAPDVLSMGREGHWGLPGMRERAARIGAKLKVLSSAANGTAVELSVPAQTAFQAQSANQPRKWFHRWKPRNTESEKLKDIKREK
jgi:signal transduction histidine kinase